MYHKRIAHHIINHIVPTEHNGFVPQLLKGRALFAMLGVGVGLFLCSQVLHVTGYLNTLADVYPATLIELTNKDRATQELPPLNVNPTLTAAAKLKANDMVSNSYFAHTSPTGLTPWHWFAQVKYVFTYAGENLAINFDESGDVEQAWLNSPTHRANVLSPNFTEIGIATQEGFYNGKKTTYVVELFGAPAVVQKTALAPEKTATVPLVPTPASQTPEVAGASATDNSSLVVIQSTPAYAEVQNTDPTIEPAPTVAATPAPVLPWYEKIILNADTYIAVIMQVIIIALVLALAGLAMREYEKHHLKHMAGGVLVAIILTSFLFVGRIGVFAEDIAPVFTTSQE